MNRERLKLRRKAMNYTLQEVADKMGVTRSTIQKYESGLIKGVETTVLERLADILECTPAYLMGWSDSPSASPFNTDSVQEEIDYESFGIKPIKLKKFPMLGKIACGEPIYANQEYETYIEASANIDADFCLTAQGDSMINARIFNGDIVFVKSQPIVNNGEIAAVIIEDTVTLKRVYMYPNRLELRPENPMYDVQNYENEELDKIKILGKAVAFQSYVR